jgi:hypothetical protein
MLIETTHSIQISGFLIEDPFFLAHVHEIQFTK